MTPPRTSLTLRRKLTEIGVPMPWITSSSAMSYEVIEQLVHNLPPTPRCTLEPAGILVVAGPAGQAHAEAVRLCTRERIDVATIRTAGCGSQPITSPREAAALAAEVRTRGSQSCVVVVATDSSGDLGQAEDVAWAAEIIAALAPEQLYAVVDATCRVTDVRRTLAVLGDVTALAVVAVARSSSPASLWELDVPICSIDGAVATRGAWAAMLIDRLHGMDGS